MNLKEIWLSLLAFTQITFTQPVIDNIDENKTKIDEIVFDEKKDNNFVFCDILNIENIASIYKIKGWELSLDKIKNRLLFIKEVYEDEINKRLIEEKEYFVKISKIYKSIKKEKLVNWNFIWDLEKINLLWNFEDNKIDDLSIETYTILWFFLEELSQNIKNLEKIVKKPLRISFLEWFNNCESWSFNWEYITLNILNFDEDSNDSIKNTIIHETQHAKSVNKKNESALILNSYNRFLINNLTDYWELIIMEWKSINEIEKDNEIIVKFLKIEADLFVDLIFDNKIYNEEELKVILEKNNIKLLKFISEIYFYFKGKSNWNNKYDLSILEEFIDNYESDVTEEIKNYFKVKIKNYFDEKRKEKINISLKKYSKHWNDLVDFIKILEKVKSPIKPISYNWKLDVGWKISLKEDYWENNEAFKIIEEWWKYFKLFDFSIDCTNLSIDELKVELLIKAKKSGAFFKNINKNFTNWIMIITSNIEERNNNLEKLPKALSDRINYIKNNSELYVRFKMLQDYMKFNNISIDEKWIELLYEDVKKWKIHFNDLWKWDALELYKNQTNNLLIILKDLI